MGFIINQKMAASVALKVGTLGSRTRSGKTKASRGSSAARLRFVWTPRASISRG